MALLEVDIRVGVTAIWFSVPGAMWNLKQLDLVLFKFFVNMLMWNLNFRLKQLDLVLLNGFLNVEPKPARFNFVNGFVNVETKTATFSFVTPFS